ncbi:putative WRKY transcription factor 65 [Cinnamomum micranthum f. kanehirae]|uniref:Putative WRKY transcription factor 65 n=1 Tax=Cinnamomum micranthum f. kanehirae TaxID=337451 RepID=A0A3S4Q150_9MAGN|nr:putative WRKY transcription factor 65 [Cinnamomum micranthum f. kanehirae]
MEGRFITNPFISDQEEPGTTPENGPFYIGKTSATSSPKRRRGAVAERRVVSVPIGEVEGSTNPPSDSWAWRKYGQKPIKGSPYPRCVRPPSIVRLESNWTYPSPPAAMGGRLPRRRLILENHSCPARKQVERSRVDPTMLVITYACDHNHPWPTSRNPTKSDVKPAETEPAVLSGPAETDPDDSFHDLEPDATMLAEDYSWFSDVASSPAKDPLLEGPIFAGTDADVATSVFPMGEEDESLFGDLGELPECSVVFRRCSLREAPWCGSTG